MTDTPPPSGTVTFLFTDIEGSTRLEHEIGTPRYAELRERHREILRSAFLIHGGAEQSTEGDSFFVVFGSARQAVAAAIEAQRGLAQEPWPEGARIQVRMGLHSGEAGEAGGTLVGLDINRAARIAAAAHGEQVLVSDATRALVEGQLPADARLVELGAFRLKDLPSPEKLTQVTTDDLRQSFPPPRSIDTNPTNLPTQLTTFIGRDAELTEAARLLETTRLLTLTGPGGTGKTRLSLELANRVANDFPDGTFFVPLEPVRDPMLVPSRIAAILGIHEAGARPVGDLMAEWLRDRRVLLVLDNFEQVTDAGPVVAELLRAASGLKVVVTSRAALRVSGEQELPVPGLPAPPDPSQLSTTERLQLPGGSRTVDPEALNQYAAVRLFIERALAVRPSFRVTNENAPAVAGISARLHGMPLAIELAAARIKLLSPDAILVRLEHQLDVLAAGSRDLPARQQTLRGAIAWSYDLLDDGARRLLDRMSIFATGCDLETAEAVCGPAADLGGDLLDGLMALADQSLVKVEETPDGEPRFRLLDTIREFAAERLAARGEMQAVQDRHRDWYLALAERAAGELSGADQRRWLDRLELEHDDIRAVLDRAVAAREPAVAIRLGFAMWRLWQKHGHLAEARRRLEQMAAADWSHDDPRLRARLVEALGGVCWWQADVEQMQRWYAEALEIWEGLGDDAELANAHYNISFAYAVPSNPGEAIEVNDPDRVGLAHLTTARDLFRNVGNPNGEANALWGIGNYHYFRNLPGQGTEQFREALEMFRRSGDRTMEAWALHMLGTSLLRQGFTDEARQHVTHALRHFQDAGDTAGITLTFDDLSAIAVAEGDLARAARLRGAARNLATETGTMLASFVEDMFEQQIRPSVRSHMDPADIERIGAEGAALPLDEAVAYALEGSTGAASHEDASA
jgi:predicted ATPase/class 3 adenylate cyclase